MQILSPGANNSTSRDKFNLKDFAENYINENAKYAGLWVAIDDNIVAIKKPMLLQPKHYKDFYGYPLRNFIAKMGSELAYLKGELNEITRF